eukprot:TRINITY_DN12296_c0_g1_i1.p4 TRINITY_DN12296_c0_g1~~TRINITY_DN12296_c0_g1_i1.p4  ORF type:complete len:103 (+),score=18.81 TRINITY_DN12296_c0_g1_i1:165-473(+)
MAVLGEHPLYGPAGLDRKLGQNGLNADRGRDMVDEVDQRRKACDRQNHTNGHGEQRNEAGTAASPDGGKHEQAIHERGKERAQYDLIATVAHEISQHAWAEL